MSLLQKYRSKYRYLAIALASVILISLALILGLRKTVTLSVDGHSLRLTTYALKVGDLLYSQAISLSPQDALSPSQAAWLKNGVTISLLRAIPVQILADGVIYSLISPERSPSGLLAEAGVHALPGDLLLSNGQPVEFKPILPARCSIHLITGTSLDQFQPHHGR